MAILYIVGAGLSGLSMLLSVAGLVTYTLHPRATALLNAMVAWLATIILLAANLVTTIGGDEATDQINKLGSDIGLSASAGGKFKAIAWAAFAVMALTAIYWTYEVFAALMARRRRLPRGNYEKYPLPPRQSRRHNRR